MPPSVQPSPRITVVGAGLAGSEAAWQIARNGVPVLLYEMRPTTLTPAHETALFAELVCSNSLGSLLPDRATGLLQEELRRMGSLLLQAADRARVPAGGALAVDRIAFAETVTSALEHHPLIEIRREEVRALTETDTPTIVATGPLTSPALEQALTGITGQESLFFFDAMAPIVDQDTIDSSVCFRASRYERGENPEGDYLNCPMDQEQYRAFHQALVTAEQVPLRVFEQEDSRFFEGCLPVEEIARRGPDSLLFGPLRPVGLADPRTGRRPFAVVQLRQDNLADSLYNMVGFQTNLRYGEQERVFRMIPGLERARFVRLGQMHRNTFINAPRVLLPSLQVRERPALLFAGQITGVEGYVGSIASGLVAGVNALRIYRGMEPFVPPVETMTGALLHYISHADPAEFQPMKANFGIVPPLDTQKRLGKRDRYRHYAERALERLDRALAEAGMAVPPTPGAEPQP
jgi:methylenetetrahydrofolate--tRNA-(uracil-5-)-methyltransferase